MTPVLEVSGILAAWFSMLAAGDRFIRRILEDGPDVDAIFSGVAPQRRAKP